MKKQRTTLISLQCESPMFGHTMCDGRVAVAGVMATCLCSCHKQKQTTKSLSRLLP